MFLHLSNFIALVALVLLVGYIAIASTAHTATATKKEVQHSISQHLDQPLNSISYGK